MAIEHTARNRGGEKVWLAWIANQYVYDGARFPRVYRRAMKGIVMIKGSDKDAEQALARFCKHWAIAGRFIRRLLN